MKQSNARSVAVIGAGFSGLSAAAYLAADGYEVTVYEKNDQPGGRAYTVEQDGFRFELGPSWYMMPDVYEDFFADFGMKSSQFYSLKRLAPSYRAFFAESSIDISDLASTAHTFETLEPGAGRRLVEFTSKSESLYTLARAHFLEQDYSSKARLLGAKTLANILRLPVTRTYHQKVAQYFTRKELQQVLEFMTVFLGGEPRATPALYTLLAHVDLNLGIWYPAGGFQAVASALESVAKQKGATFKYGAAVEEILVEGGTATGVRVGGKVQHHDYVVATADYQFVDTKLIKKQTSRHSAKWDRAKLSPSAVLLSFGFKKKLPNLLHHNLFFDSEWSSNFARIYKQKKLSKKPLFYACVPSKTDSNVAPKGCENMFVLIPAPSGVYPKKSDLSRLRKDILQRVSERVGFDVSEFIVSEDVRDASYFSATFNAYKGNAFGLSHTLFQSAFLRPPIVSKKVAGLFYAGQYTNPGTGVPLCILSGKVAANAVREASSG